MLWTCLREGVNPIQVEIAPIYKLGPALSILQGLLDAFLTSGYLFPKGLLCVAFVCVVCRIE